MAKKEKKEKVDNAPASVPQEEKPTGVLPPVAPVETVNISKSEWENLQKQIEMLTAVADKGRVFNYESSKAQKKPMVVKLSKYQGKLIVGWRVVLDELKKHPTTGLTIGEVQEYELTLLGDDGVKTNITINGYPAFSNARYTERIDAEVVGKKEDWDGNFTFDLRLPNGRVITLDSRFVN